jgi:hypothetical protein
MYNCKILFEYFNFIQSSHTCTCFCHEIFLQQITILLLIIWFCDNCKMFFAFFTLVQCSVPFGGTLFQQVVGIPMGTNCAPLLADLCLYSYESEFLQKLVKGKKIHEKIYDLKIEVVPFIINCSTELTTVVKFEVYVQPHLYLRNRLLDQDYKKIRLIRSF